MPGPSPAIWLDLALGVPSMDTTRAREVATGVGQTQGVKPSQ